MSQPSTGDDLQDVRGELLGFVHVLRRAGLTVPTGQVLAYTAAAAVVAPADLRDLYHCGRVTLVSHPRDLPAYDQAFRTWFRDDEPAARAQDDAASVPAADEALPDGAPPPELPSVDEPLPGETVTVGARASDLEALRHRRFDQLREDELVALRRLMAQLPLSVPRRRTRRTETVRRGRVPDLRRSVRRALGTDGELIDRAWRQRRHVQRPLVLVLDVSGSMAGYSRALLQFAFTTRRHARNVEVFAFGTRLTRLTEQLDRRDPDAALAAASQRIVDWDGGTRIGESLATLNREHGRRGRLRGAIVVVCSDGLERGDPELLAREAARLSRSVHRLVWVNPLRADPDYEPVQRGTRAVQPAVDRFVSGHDLASLEQLGRVLRELA